MRESGARLKDSVLTIRVTASRLRRARAAIFLRFAGSRPIGASMRRPGCTSPQHERDVLFLDLAIAELACQLRMRRIVLGDNHQSGSAAVEAMHDARPLLAADAAQILDVVQQRVDQRATGVTGRGMDDHSCRLVDDDDICVLEHDLERQRLRLDVGGSRLRNIDRESTDRA